MPNLYIIAGCNGAGKTTASFTILPEILNCREFVNADEIARGISPFNIEKAAFTAGRLMLARINDLIIEQQDFAFETTLATKSYAALIQKARLNGFTITVLFLWLNSFELAKERVRVRVKNGGHNIPEDVIERRYSRGLKNLFSIYIPLVDQFFIADNSHGASEIIVQGKSKQEIEIFNSEIWNQIKSAYDE